MLKHRLLHPEISEILARAGHHAKVLIADGNYPASTTLGPNARLVSLNLAPGIVTVSQVLETLLTAIPVDAINTMGIPADDPYAQKGDPVVWADYRRIVAESGSTLKLTLPTRSRRNARSRRKCSSRRTLPSLRVRLASMPLRIHTSSCARNLSNLPLCTASAASISAFLLS